MVAMPFYVYLPLQLFIALLLSVTILPSILAAEDERQVYIAYMGALPTHDYTAEAVHLNLLEQVLEGSLAKESLLYSYGRSFNGFAAKLTAEEQRKLAEKESVISVFPSGIHHLHTTRSWDFLGFPETSTHNRTAESEIIVGMIDTGIWPASASFDDVGFGAPPSTWKGICQNITCNNKIIGARYYYSASTNADPELEISALDFEGHGTHTASTVAGREVKNASLYGIARGTVRGAVPSARIAVYKVCWGPEGCADHDILAAFDDAIADGVDLISISMGKRGVSNYFADSIAIGSFHAMKAGILTSSSAGNAGPLSSTVGNTAPWMLTVAASTIDRRLLDRLVIDNREVIKGNSINTFKTEKSSYPFIYAGNALKKGYSGPRLGTCDPDSLDGDAVKGKVVLCDARVNGEEPLRAGAKGAVMVDYEHLDVSWNFPLPAVVVDTSEGRTLRNYINSSRDPVANIHRTAGITDESAPKIASFSSRGPNPVVPDILKPDISAPGLNIISAWSTVARISEYIDDKRSVPYNIMSGTSASCPHAAGVAAYIKSFHPDFSPAALLSAIITTATPMDPSKNPEAELAYGAGQINPTKAADPGLVYDAGTNDYIQMLCSLGYNNDEIRLISGDPTSYCNVDSIRAAKDLNYPSMAFQVTPDSPYKPYSVNFSRTVSNVGGAKATYRATIQTRGNIKVVVYPDVLSFTAEREKQSFVVSASSDEGIASSETASASLVWSDGVHTVRSPVVMHTGYME